MKPFAPLIVLTLTALVGHVNAHGYISKPRASYKPNTIYTTYNCLTDASINKGFAGGIYNAEPEKNADQFAAHWNRTGYSSLREMLDTVSPGYGFSLDTADPVDVSGYKEMWWQNDEYKQGLIQSHCGPCEGYIDNVMAFHYDNCAKQFTSYPAKIPTDFSLCKKDKCLFVFYWLALHTSKWQVYKQCVPISNKGSGKSSGKGSTTKHNASKNTPITPAAPLTTDFVQAEAETAPMSTLAAVTSTTKPAGSCKRRMRS